jgi:undecaprenyl pyrophosphate phosphatase UppP
MGGIKLGCKSHSMKEYTTLQVLRSLQRPIITEGFTELVRVSSTSHVLLEQIRDVKTDMLFKGGRRTFFSTRVQTV